MKTSIFQIIYNPCIILKYLSLHIHQHHHLHAYHQFSNNRLVFEIVEKNPTYLAAVRPIYDPYLRQTEPKIFPRVLPASRWTKRKPKQNKQMKPVKTSYVFISYTNRVSFSISTTLILQTKNNDQVKFKIKLLFELIYIFMFYCG